MTVYLDVIFLENLVINYIILYVTGIVSKAKTKQIRIMAGALIGAVYSIIYYVIPLKIYLGLFVKVILSIIIIYVAFNAKKAKLLAKQVLLFYLVSFVFGGAVIALIYMVNYQNITIQNGVVVGKYTMKIILIGIVIAYFITILGFNIIKSKLSKKDLICDVKLKINNKEIQTKAMIDTGNLLKDPITNIPVIVMEYNLFYNILPKEILNNINDILNGNLSDVPDEIQNEYMHKLKVIPFSSLGKQNGLLLGIKAQNLKIKTEETEKTLENIIIGLYDKSLTKKGEYRALVGVEIF